MEKKLTVYTAGVVIIGENLAQRQINIKEYGSVIAEYSPEIGGWSTKHGYVESDGNIIDEMCCLARMYGIKELRMH